MTAPSLVLGTAGHIDHGKSTLVEALTGTNPDRLPEEKERGVTIELGFARLELPSGRSMGVVDVPGHERFVRQMVAGATGIDVVMLCVAADDGVMPQTREHLAIIDLLGIPTGIVALTKSDLAESDWLALVTDDIRALLEGTTIEGAPVVPVSARTGAGLDDLRAALDSVAGEAEARQAGLPMRLPVDRVFTIVGAGTIVTGTLWSGTAAKDDPVEVLPGHRKARVRSVQVHSESVERATAGQRVALNLAGVERSEVARGDVVAAPGTLTVTDRIDAYVTYLAAESRAFETGTAVHVHHGTREVIGRVLLMDAETLRPGERCFAQIRLDEPIMPRYQDRFIIRSLSPMWTIGGGTVLDVSPPRRTTPKPAERELLAALLSGDVPAAAVGLVIARQLPMSSAEVALALGLERAEVADGLNRSELARLKVGAETCYIASSSLDALVAAVEAELLAFHAAEPTATSASTAALKDRVDKRLAPDVFDAVLSVAGERGVAVVDKGTVRHPEAGVSALAAEEEAASRLLPLLTSQGLATGTPADLAAAVGVDRGVASKVLGRLASEGAVVRVGSDMHFSAEVVRAARERLVGALRERPSGATAAELRDALGASRKYAIPLLEYFDAQGLTKREGDLRVLRGS